MPHIHVRFDRSHDHSHDIVFGELDQLPQYIESAGVAIGRCVLVTDVHVGGLYGDVVEDALESARWQCTRVTLPAGETSKSLDRVSEVLDAALEFGVERRSPVIALGGGVIGDVAGFSAAILLRGVPLIQVPTSLVAQVDSSIGGKTGVNHPTGKNLVGAFLQPALVLVDTKVLSTLPKSEWTAGLSEVVKTALIRDHSLFEWLNERWGDVMARDPATVLEMVRRCAEIKAAVVQEDEREGGVRAILNFGHTFGHALETVRGYSGITHGGAVAIGMRAALHLSRRRYPDQDFAPALQLVEQLSAPNPGVGIGIDNLVVAMQMDKKRVSDRLRIVLLESPGSAIIVDDMDEAEIREAWAFALGPFK